MVGYEHLVRTCFFRWAIGSPYLCCSIYAELLDVQVLGLHLPPCVCVVNAPRLCVSFGHKVVI